MSQFGRPAMINAGEATAFPRPHNMMSVNYFEPQRHWAVTQWRGQQEGHRLFGSGLGKAEALKRAALVARIFPEYAGCRVTPIDG